MIKIRYVIIATTITFSSIVTLESLPTFAKTSVEMTADKKKVDQRIKRIQTQLKENEKEVEAHIQSFYTLKEEIADLEASIDVTREDVSERQAIINKRLKAYQAQDATFSPYINAIFGAENFTKMITRTLSVKKVIEADTKLQTEQQNDMASLTKANTKLKKQQQALTSQFQQLQEQQEQLQLKKIEARAKSLKLKETIATTKEKEALQAARKKAEAEAKKIKAAQLQAEKAAKQAAKQLALQQAALKSEQVSEEKASEKEEATKTTEITETEVEQTTSSTQAQNAGNGTNGAKVSDDDQATPTVDGSSTAQAIIAEASKYMGTAYVWGGSTPTTGFDCSGLTSWSFKQSGVTIPRTAAQQYAASTKITAEQAKAGDLVFFSYGKGVAHVGIYLGDGRMLNSQNSGVVIDQLAGYWEKYIVGYGRFSGVNK